MKRVVTDVQDRRTQMVSDEHLLPTILSQNVWKVSSTRDTGEVEFEGLTVSLELV